MNSYQLDSNDKKLRKNWLFIAFIKYLGLPILALALIGILSTKFDFDEKIFYGYIFFLIAGIIWLPILYYRAYKKYGTILLGLFLIIGPFAMLKSLLESFSALTQLKAPMHEYLLILVDLAVFVWWYVLCYNMRKLNKKIRFYPLTFSKCYIEAKQAFDEALTLENLNEKFALLLRSKEDGNLQKEDILRYAYKERMQALAARSAEAS